MSMRYMKVGLSVLLLGMQMGCTGSTDEERDEVQIKGGKLSMGCDTDTFTCPDTELPRHSVTLQGYYIDRVEVSAAAYADFLNAHGNECAGQPCAADSELFGSPPILRDGDSWRAVTGREAQAVTMVSWHGADAYCRYVDARLCSESEWERAARGPCDALGDCDGQVNLYPWGNAAPSCERVHMMATEKGCDTGQPADIGSYPVGQSPEGVMDLAGNAWEWVADAWHPTYDGHPSDGTVWLDETTDLRVVRGGGLGSLADTLRSAHRWNGGAYDLGPDYGFRCCRDL